MQNVVITVLLCVVALIVGAVIAGFIAYRKGVTVGTENRRRRDEQIRDDAEKEAEKIRAAAQKVRDEADRIRDDAVRDAEISRKNAVVEAKDEIHKRRAEMEKELKDRRNEIGRTERRIQQKEENLDKKTESLEKKDESLKKKIKQAEDRLAMAEAVKADQLTELERISGLTSAAAREELLEQLDTQLVHEKATLVTAYEQQIKDECEEKARDYISLAIAKCASDQVSESAVSVVALPNDEMKGRIIGREGRNIRTLETLTGVDIIIDDTPEAITLSCFDHVRREVARIALEKLIADGRIHPTKIEEMVEKAQHEVEHRIKQEGHRALLETNVHGVNNELMKLLGRLYYRTSYRQNVLAHSVEVARIAGVMASEIGADANLARRAGLLHDIGKALTAEIEGSHVQIGVDVCRKYNESEEVIHAIEAHHGDVEPQTPEACLVQAADAISAARPGARSENYENYIKRLEKLEGICSAYDGVEKCYALQAGREIRVMVKPEVMGDEKMVLVARRIAEQIENEMDYPGQIKVNLIRESRAVEYAK